MRAAFAWLLAALMLAAAPAHAVTYPERPEGPVLDEAGIIPDQREAALSARLQEYNQRTGRSLVVATVPSLEGETIELYSVRLFEQWGIGGSETDQGLLLLVAPNERKVRIEVGYGLHQYITDALSGRIIRNQITPEFREGDMAAGIEAGVNALIEQLNRTPADAQAVAEAAAAAEAGQAGEGASAGGVIFWIVMIVFFMLFFGRRGRGRGRRFSGSGLAPIILWEAARHVGGRGGGFGGGGFGGGGGGFGGFGGGMSGGGGASGSW